jgi:hypothetical protein
MKLGHFIRTIKEGYQNAIYNELNKKENWDSLLIYIHVSRLIIGCIFGIIIGVLIGLLIWGIKI